jgi:hypothetical protein
VQSTDLRLLRVDAVTRHACRAMPATKQLGGPDYSLTAKPKTSNSRAEVLAADR